MQLITAILMFIYYALGATGAIMLINGHPFALEESKKVYTFNNFMNGILLGSAVVLGFIYLDEGFNSIAQCAVAYYCFSVAEAAFKLNRPLNLGPAWGYRHLIVSALAIAGIIYAYGH